MLVLSSVSFRFGLYVHVFEKMSTMKLRVSGDTVERKDFGLVICNHPSEADWLFFWSVTNRWHSMSTTRVILKDVSAPMEKAHWQMLDNDDNSWCWLGNGYPSLFILVQKLGTRQRANCILLFLLCARPTTFLASPLPWRNWLQSSQAHSRSQGICLFLFLQLVTNKKKPLSKVCLAAQHPCVPKLVDPKDEGISCYCAWYETSFGCDLWLHLGVRRRQ